MRAEEILEIDPDVIGHINGGHTAFAHKEIRCLCEGCGRALEIVHNGNEFAALYALRTAKETGQLDRIIIGTDAPYGAGVPALGMLRVIALLSSFGGVPAEQAFCFATGNTARVHKLNAEMVEPGRDADLVILDRAQGTAGSTLLESVELGDLPGIGMILVDGEVLVHPSRNTPPATRLPVIREAARRPEKATG
jgi:enamidase